MKLELEIVKFFVHLESKNISISGHTNKYLIQKYYEHLGLCENQSLEHWFSGLATKKYPVYTDTNNAVKKARNYELKWQRET